MSYDIENIKEIIPISIIFKIIKCSNCIRICLNVTLYQSHYTNEISVAINIFTVQIFYLTTIISSPLSSMAQ